jgi:Transcription factor zinc-finger
MVDEKDRLGEKLRDVEAGREEQWARKRDAELLEKMRTKAAGGMSCPQCKGALVARVENGTAVFACPSGHGAWVDAATLKRLLREAK